MPKTTPFKINQMKHSDKKIIALTAYTYPMAKIVDEYADFILVGDSLGMVIYGMDSTLPVSLEMMIAHGKAVVKASEKSCVIIDMPFGSYQQSPEQAFENAAFLLQETGADGVKIEGGEIMADTITFLTRRGIPVLAHIGMEPQSVNIYGGYKKQGKDDASKKRIFADAKSVQEAGAFATVIEHVDSDFTQQVTELLHIPTIGIGAGQKCDGQIMVTEDIIGLSGNDSPSFAKQHIDLSKEIRGALGDYCSSIHND